LKRRGIVAVAAIAASGVLAGTLAQGAPARPDAASLKLAASKTQLKFSVSSLKAKHGKVTITMTNPSGISHAIAVEGHGVDKDGKTVGKGGKSTVTVTLKKGKYTFYCPVDGHRAAGMKGTLTVS
jgi:plastocyanin